MAAVGARIRVPIAVACRVLGLSTQGYYKWLKDPVCRRDYDDAHLMNKLHDLHTDDATLGYRFLTDELEVERQRRAAPQAQRPAAGAAPAQQQRQQR